MKYLSFNSHITLVHFWGVWSCDSKMATSLDGGRGPNLGGHFSGSRVNVKELKDFYRAELFAFLDDCVGSKVSCLDHLKSFDSYRVTQVTTQPIFRSWYGMMI